MITLQQDTIYMGTAAPASGGGGSGDAVWGSITGTLSNQTDLANALAAKQDTLTAGSNITISGDTISATDTTYSAFTGATGSVAGSAGLVPAPAATDNDKYLKGDGTWAAVSSDGLQNTATGNGSLTILGTATSSNESINIGASSLASGYEAIAIGSVTGDNDPTSAYNNAVAIGWSAIAYNDSIAIGNLADARASTSSVVIGGEVLNGEGGADHAEAGDYAVSVGAASRSDDYSVAVGANSSAMYNYSIALGYGAAASQDYEFVVGGYDTQNSQPQTFTLMDLSTGKIPNDRINADVTPTQNSTNMITSGAVYTVLGDIETLLAAI